MPFLPHLVAHLRLAFAFAAGLVAALLLPPDLGLVTEALVGWNVAVWLYLAQAAWAMVRADHAHVQRVAEAQAETIGVVLLLGVAGAVASLAGTVLQLSAAREAGAHAWGHVALALMTVAGSWLLVPMLFTLAYASRFHSGTPRHGLAFPEGDHFRPLYGDFLYVAFTIAVASQTADVAISTAPMRRLVLLQSVIAFAFNTAVLAFTINLAAGMV